MRHNAVMGVVAVACVAVMNGQALGPMGRLHLHKGDRAGARNQHVAGMGFFDEEAPSGAPGLTFSNAQLGLARLLTFPKFTADAADDAPDAPTPAPANMGFGRPASGVGPVSTPQAAPPSQDKPPQDPPPADPPPRAGSPPAASWVDAALTPDKPAPIPEPATWMMMVLGFGAAAVMLRRGRRHRLRRSAARLRGSSRR